jgi:sugar diacid utilization regulator
MPIFCGEIIKVKCVKELTLIGGKGGLFRILRWTNISRFDEAVMWGQKGELIFIVDDIIEKKQEDILNFMKIINEKEIAGLVICDTSFKVQKDLDYLISLSNTHNMPLFKVPSIDFIEKLIRKICNFIIIKHIDLKNKQNILEDILFSDDILNDNIEKRLKYYGYDLKKDLCTIVIADIDNFEEFILTNQLKNESEILKIKDVFETIIEEKLLDFKTNVVYMFRSDSIVMLVPYGNDDINKAFLDDIRNNVENRIKGLTVSVGRGNPYSKIKDFKKSFIEAEQALKIYKILNSTNITCNYSDVGVFSIISKVSDKNELESFYKVNLEKLVEFDRINKTDLLSTLGTFFCKNCNIVKTAESLYLHRNTLRSRFKKIEEILEIDLENTSDKFNIYMSLLIYEFLKV